MRTLTPDEWYLRFTCHHCKVQQILFPDLSRGKADIRATYAVECPDCHHKSSYDSEEIERYHHPPDADQV